MKILKTILIVFKVINSLKRDKIFYKLYSKLDFIIILHKDHQPLIFMNDFSFILDFPTFINLC